MPKKKAASKKLAGKKSPPKKRKAPRRVEIIPELQILGPELGARLYLLAEKRGVLFPEVLREAVQKLLEAELVEPTTNAKDDALYPPTDQPLEEAPVLRSKEPSDDQVHERETLPGEVAPENGTTH